MTKAIVESIPVDQCICGEQADPKQEVCFADKHRTSKQQRTLREAYARLERLREGAVARSECAPNEGN